MEKMLGDMNVKMNGNEFPNGKDPQYYVNTLI